MAPKKEKSDKSILEDGRRIILDYLQQQNRPYSAIDITANLHNKVSKAFTVKILKELHEKGDIEGRVSGKQVIYHVHQEAPDLSTPEQVARLKIVIENLRSAKASTKATERGLRQELFTLSTQVSTVDLRIMIENFTAERAAFIARLELPCMSDGVDGSGTGQRMTGEEEKRIDYQWKLWKRYVQTRKRICKDIWDKCTEVLPEGVRDQEEFWEGLGLEGSLS